MEAEKVCREYYDKIPISIIRPPAIYGPHDSAMVPVFKSIRKGFRLNIGAEKFMSFAYVEDVVDGIVSASENEKAVDLIFNIAPKEAYPWDYIQLKTAEILGVKTINIRIPGFVAMGYGYLLTILSKLTGRSYFTDAQKMRELLARYWIADTTRASELLGYRAMHSLEEGLRKTLEWYQQQGWL